MNETKSTMVRVKLKTLKQILAIFPAMKDEPMTSYFARLAAWLSERNE